MTKEQGIIEVCANAVFHINLYMVFHKFMDKQKHKNKPSLSICFLQFSTEKLKIRSSLFIGHALLFILTMQNLHINIIIDRNTPPFYQKKKMKNLKLLNIYSDKIFA